MNAKKLGMGIGTLGTVITLVAGCGTTNGTSASNNSSSGSGSGASKTITIGYITWDEDVAATYLWKNLLESKGYTVQLQQLDPGPLFAGLSKDNLNVFFDTWLPDTHKQYIAQYGSQLTSLGKWYQGSTTEGFVVPTYMKNVNSILDLKNISNQIQGKIVGIEAGAGETGLAQQAIKDYGLPETLQTSSTPAMLAALKKAYDAKQPIVVTLWSPHWAFSQYKLKYLSDPKKSFGAGGWIQTEANKNWASSNPTVVKWLKNFKLTQSQLGQLETDINNDGDTQGVQEWVSANQSLVDSWLNS
ncbi:hypothetical protein AAC03nite_34310 [Alicyclobacillus acidoterrestris]|uniref:glycine betaine ABC transporter substrate-binding protein n=1 Tax=Alicyclobacillus suci TaxID=2816080 RepID=UPI0011924A82|nr:glycine betaine ABC transporter substrate-binding protein [Alicyclobacillus suci]GEO27646.1 hypothetical protein AAC03nite_34310 [Alicyclobacillus acidoterrestris]